MLKVYLAHPISTTGEFNDSIRVAKRIEGVGAINIASRGGNEPLVFRKFDVYAPALNDEINDKSNNPTPAMIYMQDVDNLLLSDIVVVNYTGGDADGTVLELGMLAGMYEAMYKSAGFVVEAAQGAVKCTTTGIESTTWGMVDSVHELVVNYLPIVLAYSSNKRALQPQLHHGVASGKLNHMALGAIDKHFVWCGDEEGMIRELQKLNESEESKELGRKQDAITRALYESIAGDES